MEKITFGGKLIGYRIKRGKGKKSIAIKVSDTSQVIVSAPKGLSKEKIREIVEKKAGWIDRKQAYFKELNKLYPKKEYISGEQVLFRGRKYRLKIIETGDSPSTEMTLMGRRISIFIKKNLPERKKKETIKEALAKWFQSRSLEFISQRAKRYGQLLNLTPKKIIVRNQEKRWGSCSKSGVLRFNWRISMAPVSIIDYVVVHEICHLKERNHSSDFWRQVALVILDYKRRRQWLRENFAGLEI